MSLWKRAALSTLLVLCAAIALAPSAGPSKRIPNGVRIAGVNVSGLDRHAASLQVRPRALGGLARAARNDRCDRGRGVEGS
jgi:hypothetical protein